MLMKRKKPETKDAHVESVLDMIEARDMDTIWLILEKLANNELDTDCEGLSRSEAVEQICEIISWRSECVRDREVENAMNDYSECEEHA